MWCEKIDLKCTLLGGISACCWCCALLFRIVEKGNVCEMNQEYILKWISIAELCQWEKENDFLCWVWLDLVKAFKRFVWQEERFNVTEGYRCHLIHHLFTLRRFMQPASLQIYSNGIQSYAMSCNLGFFLMFAVVVRGFDLRVWYWFLSASHYEPRKLRHSLHNWIMH